MIKHIHALFAYIAFLCIIMFWFSTAVVELMYEHETVALVKHLIICPGLCILVPSIAITAISGRKLAKSSQKIELIIVKKKRMPVIAILGIVVLIPCAIVLDALASEGCFDMKFYLIQLLELAAGGVNAVLMMKNIYDSKRFSKI